MKIFNVKAILIGSLIFNSFSVMALDQQIIQQKAREAQVWLINNKKKIISLGLAISAILGTGYLAGKAQPKLKVIDVYQKYQVYLPDPNKGNTSEERNRLNNLRTTIYRLGLIAYTEGIEGLRSLIQTNEQRIFFERILTAYPDLDEALAELAKVSPDEIIKLHYSRRIISLEK